MLGRILKEKGCQGDKSLIENSCYLFISVHKKVVKDIAQKTYEAMALHQNHQLGTVLIVHNLHFTEED